jgi:N-acetylneuraminic acid mutarotase
MLLAGGGAVSAAHAGWAAEPTAGRWSQAPALPTARTEVAAALLGGRVYVAGGFTGDGRASALVEVFDLAAGTWQRSAPLPAPRHHVGLVALGERLYLIGGYGDGWDAVADVYVYEPSADRWREGPALPAPRGALAAAVLGGHAHAVGGAARRHNTKAHDALDPARARWTTLAPLPTARDHLAVVALPSGRLLAGGGRVNGDYGRNLDAVEVYDPPGDRWRRAAPLPAPRSGVAGALLGGRALVLGGENPSGTQADTFAYDEPADRWSALAPIPTARHGLAAVAAGDRLHTIGGGPRPGLTVTGAHEILEL